MAISTAHTDRAEASYGIATLNISSGRFVFGEVSGSDALLTEIERTKPAEVLVADDAQVLHRLVRHPALRQRPIWEFDEANAKRLLIAQFGVKDLTRIPAKTYTWLCRRRDVCFSMRRNPALGVAAFAGNTSRATAIASSLTQLMAQPRD